MARCDTTISSEEYVLPEVEAVMAGTLALMTGYAQARCATQRRLMMGKIVSNIALLGDHPHLSAPFRCAVRKLRCHWELLLEADGEAQHPAKLQHPAPVTLQ